MAKVIRVAKLDLATILQQQNPTIDLRIDAYEESTRNFRNAVALYSQRAMTEITRRKNEYSTRKSKIAEKTKQVENETNACKVRELELMKGEFVSNIPFPRIHSNVYVFSFGTRTRRTKGGRIFCGCLPAATSVY